MVRKHETYCFKLLLNLFRRTKLTKQSVQVRKRKLSMRQSCCGVQCRCDVLLCQAHQSVLPLTSSDLDLICHQLLSLRYYLALEFEIFPNFFHLLKAIFATHPQEAHIIA